MRICNYSIGLLVLLALFVSSCQGALHTPMPHVPVVVGKVKVKTPSIPGGVAVNARTGYVYIANAQEIAVLKETDIIKEIQTEGGDAKSMAVDETNGLVYVVNSDNDNVTVIREIEVVGIVPTVGKNPTSVAVEPRNGFAYVVSGYRSRPLGAEPLEGNILVLNGIQVIDNLKLGALIPRQVVADPVGGYVYAGGSKEMIVLKGLREVTRHKTKSLDSMDVNPRTGDVYVLANQTLYRFKDGRLIDSVDLPPDLGNTSQIRVQPLTGAVYIPHTGYVVGEARILMIQEMKVIDDIRVGALATLGIDSLYGNVYVGNRTGRGKDVGTVMVVNGTQVLATYRMEWLPYSIGVNPVNGWGYVFDGATITVLGYPPSTIPVTPKTSPTPAVYP